MKKKNVKIGGVYWAKVSGDLVKIRITGESIYGGWDAVSLKTGRSIRVKTAARLWSEVREGRGFNTCSRCGSDNNGETFWKDRGGWARLCDNCFAAYNKGEFGAAPVETVGVPRLVECPDCGRKYPANELKEDYHSAKRLCPSCLTSRAEAQARFYHRANTPHR